MSTAEIRATMSGKCQRRLFGIICLQQDFSQIFSSATIAVVYVSSGLMGGSPGVFNDAVLCLVIRTGYVFMKVMAIFVTSSRELGLRKQIPKLFAQ